MILLLGVIAAAIAFLHRNAAPATVTTTPRLRRPLITVPRIGARIAAATAQPEAAQVAQQTAGIRWQPATNIVPELTLQQIGAVPVDPSLVPPIKPLPPTLDGAAGTVVGADDHAAPLINSTLLEMGISFAGDLL